MDLSIRFIPYWPFFPQPFPQPFFARPLFGQIQFILKVFVSSLEPKLSFVPITEQMKLINISNLLILVHQIEQMLFINLK